jgi:hypothetical protein
MPITSNTIATAIIRGIKNLKAIEIGIKGGREIAVTIYKNEYKRYNNQQGSNQFRHFLPNLKLD